MKKILLFFLISIFTVLNGQDLVDIIAPLHSYDFDDAHYNSRYPYNYALRTSAINTGSPLGTAIGGATVASGQMTPEFTVNPANLAMTKYNVIQAGGLFNEYNSVNQNSLAGISYISSVPVYRGSMTFATGVNREKDYHLYYQNDDVIQRSKGGLYNWRLSTAFEIQKNVYIGAEASLLSGNKHNDIAFKTATADETQGFIEDNKYFGIGGRIGMTYHFLPVLNFGLSVDLPSFIGVSYSLREYDQNSSGSIDYSLRSPAVLRAGLALTLKIVDFYYSYDYTNWQDLYVSSSDLTLIAQDELNRDIMNNFNITHSHHFGLGLHVPKLPLHFYFGYQYLPDAYQGLNGFSLGNLVPRELADRFRSSFSWGGTLFLKQGISISASFETYHTFYDGDREKPRNTNLSMSYFF